jgi:hypothetical protein
MIALQATSQVRLKVDNSIYTCYTDEENRKIAVIMLKGERDSVALSLCNRTAILFRAEVKALNAKADIAEQSVKLCKQSYDKVNLELVKANTKIEKMKRNRWIAIGAAGLLGLVVIAK